ncbi:hypothetical protein [Streptomyces ortus]|uniref:Uncharacterized protein n=1 Tax=Streptomyces ortus TaxID=2867268 RepID=A0ABT3V122_9ACTN|nr:hypothetical protein [Streptomyces ortus]MCX4233528.1 hypothetical protein [Streptomyces ortus]
MTGQHEPSEAEPELSRESGLRVIQYQRAGDRARLRLFAVLKAQDVPADEANDLVAALEAGAVAGARSEVVGLETAGPATQSTAFKDGWTNGVKVAGEALLGIADRSWSRQGNWSNKASELVDPATSASLSEVASPVASPTTRQVTVEEGTELPAKLMSRVLAICGQHFGLVTGIKSDQWDTEHTRKNIEISLQAVPLAERETYPQALDGYLRANRARLEQLWHIYGPDGLFPGVYRLVELPESFVLCERIAHGLPRLSQLWTHTVGDNNLLERLKEAWLHE